MVREVLALSRGAERAGQRLPTLAIDTDLRFRSADDRAAFTAELAAAVRDLAARHHDETAPQGRWHRLVIAVHPHPDPPRCTVNESERSIELEVEVNGTP